MGEKRRVISNFLLTVTVAITMYCQYVVIFAALPLISGCMTNFYDFLSAIQHGNISLVKMLMDTKKSRVELYTFINTTDPAGVTPLYVALDNKMADIANLLIKTAARPNALIRYQRPLHMAAAASELISCVEFLLEKNAAVNGLNTYGESALMVALYNRNWPAAEILMKQEDVNLNVIDNCEYTALYHAVVWGRLDIVQALTDRGAYVDQLCRGGFTSFLLACHYGHEDVALFLMEKTTYIRARCFNHKTFLHHCIDSGCVNVVQKFVEKCQQDTPEKCNMILNVQDAMGRGPLSAAIKQNQTEIAIILIKGGADLNQFDYHLNSPLRLAVSNRNYPLIKKLKRRGARIAYPGEFSYFVWRDNA